MLLVIEDEARIAKQCRNRYTVAAGHQLELRSAHDACHNKGYSGRRDLAAHSQGVLGRPIVHWWRHARLGVGLVLGTKSHRTVTVLALQCIYAVT